MVGRLQASQVGSAGHLALIRVIAALIEIEKHVHFQLMEGRTHGEWFWDRGVATQWVMDMTHAVRCGLCTRNGNILGLE